jgi:hypothetical protein
LVRAAALAAAWTLGPWRIGVPSAFGQGMDHPATTQTLETYADTLATTQTLEAYADTLIPGQKRFPADRAIAGVVSGAGAVQAGRGSRATSSRKACGSAASPASSTASRATASTSPRATALAARASPIMQHRCGRRASSSSVAARSAAAKMGGFIDPATEFYGEDTVIARRASKVGKVLFAPDFSILSSRRRILEDGLFNTAFSYAQDYVRIAVGLAPTASHTDQR